MRAAARLWLALAPWLASTCNGATIITVEHECGDLASCKHLNDGECDDGGATSKYISRVKAQSGQRPSSAPVPPQGTPGGSGQLGTRRKRPAHRAPSRCLGCSSEPPPKPPVSPPLTIQVHRVSSLLGRDGLQDAVRQPPGRAPAAAAKLRAQPVGHQRRRLLGLLRCLQRRASDRHSDAHGNVCHTGLEP